MVQRRCAWPLRRGSLGAGAGIFGTHRGSGAGGFSQWIRTYGCEYGTWETPEDWGISEGVEGNYERRDDEAGVHACVALGDAFLMHYANTKKTEELAQIPRFRHGRRYLSQHVRLLGRHRLARLFEVRAQRGDRLCQECSRLRRAPAEGHRPALRIQARL